MEAETKPERDINDWRLKTVFPSGEVSRTYFTYEEIMGLGYKNVYETEEVIFMANEIGGIEPFLIDKYFDI